MTEYELSMLKISLGELIGTTVDNSLSTISILITLISGYLIAIFLADGRLSRVQLSIATVIYTLGYATLSLSLFKYLEVFSALAERLGELEKGPLNTASNSLQDYMFIILLTGVYVATIWFMLSVRSRADTNNQ